jgi:hypothetical protein
VSRIFEHAGQIVRCSWIVGRHPALWLTSMKTSLLCYLLCMVGCAAQPTPTAHPPAADPADSSVPSTLESSAWFSCRTDGDCTIVEMGCCDRCNGGWVMSVARAHVAPATARYKEQACTGVCTDRGCVDDPIPICKAGTCARRERVATSGRTKWVELDNTPR